MSVKLTAREWEELLGMVRFEAAQRRLLALHPGAPDELRAVRAQEAALYTSVAEKLEGMKWQIKQGD